MESNSVCNHTRDETNRIPASRSSDFVNHSYDYVSVKSKLKHPPRAYPGHLTSFPAREGGNLMNLVFPGAGNLITTNIHIFFNSYIL